MDNLHKILTSFQGITLEEMDDVTLLDRLDSKYIFSSRLLTEILAESKDYYKALTIGKRRLFSYRTLYFDTADNKLYLDHHNGKINRFKVRFRTYEDTGVSFLEIKYRSKNGRTLKKRIRKENIEILLSDESKRFLDENLPLGTASLEPKVYSSFKRITLVNNELTERVTIDYSLCFENENQQRKLSNLAIAEVKHYNGNKSKFFEILDNLGIYPGGMSKYCIGRVLTEDNLKYNRFKQNLLLVNKIEKDNDVN